jgi:hypothetical protein
MYQQLTNQISRKHRETELLTQRHLRSPFITSSSILFLGAGLNSISVPVNRENYRAGEGKDQPIQPGGWGTIFAETGQFPFARVYPTLSERRSGITVIHYFQYSIQISSRGKSWRTAGLSQPSPPTMTKHLNNSLCLLMK